MFLYERDAVKGSTTRLGPLQSPLPAQHEGAQRQARAGHFNDRRMRDVHLIHRRSERPNLGIAGELKRFMGFLIVTHSETEHIFYESGGSTTSPFVSRSASGRAMAHDEEQDGHSAVKQKPVDSLSNSLKNTHFVWVVAPPAWIVLSMSFGRDRVGNVAPMASPASLGTVR